MIQLKKKLGAPVPEKLATDGTAEIESLKASYDKGERQFKFNTKIYGHKEVKEALLELQNGKCCFCEAKIDHTSYGDVEHFRPKGGWVQESEQLNTPGYYWLAYNWENLFLSCQICNEQYKKNYFPLTDNTTRARSHHDNINVEQPLFIHPANEDPETFIGFKDEVPFSINNNIRGEKTITKTGIDREKLNENRRSKLNPIRQLYRLARGIPDTSPELQNEARQVVKDYFDGSNLEETEYASMLRAFFRANPL